ncbi:MAG: gamma-glutamyltransferase [Roseiarcus sp.]|jgi:gamma-glutamyltranspeptidase/glutathione hydrolase
MLSSSSSSSSSRVLLRLALAAALALPLAARADPAPIISDFAIARPVAATHGMVVSQEAAASKVGLDILKRGGNAVDAAVAVGFALAVTLPRAGNIGGGGFMLIHRADLNKTIAIDYRERAPALTTKDVFLDANGEADPYKSRFSGLAIGVPGTVAGLELAWRKYGSGKFSFADLVAPAARLARQGLAVEGDLADSLPAAAPLLAQHPSSARIYLEPDGSAPPLGARIALDDLAATLDAIAASGADAFYRGPIAGKIVAAVHEAGGRMTLDDLADYRAVEREPVRGTYRGHEIVSMPPPSSGGAHVIEILNILEGFPLAEQGLNSAASIHEMAEAEKLAYADRAAYLGDPDFVRIPLAGLISKAYADHLRASILPDRARPASEIEPGGPQRYESDQTTHFSVVDDAGDAVANTYTLNFSYGCGLVAEGTGVLLNNELDDFAARPGDANAYGLIGGEANAPGPNKRPLSSMSPTLVFKDGQIELVTGSPGGPRIITTVLQIILDVIDFGLNVAEAEEAPRVHDQGFPDELRIERGLSPDTVRLLQGMGYTVVVREAMGSANTIARSADGTLTGASDPRQRGTLAVGY